MRRSEAAALALLAAILGPASAQAAPSAAPVVAAERAFAADGLRLGVRDSFLKWSAPSAIVLAPDPANAQAVWRPRPSDASGPPLAWWPLWAGIARSGDLGFTTGPYTYDGKPGGYYFTVWKRQGDGAWRWIFDSGPPSSPEGAAPPGSPARLAPTSTEAPLHPGTAFAQVERLEADLAQAAMTEVPAAFMKVMAADGRVVGSRAAPDNSPAGQAAELQRRPRSIAFRPLGGEASAAGDLVWTYGEARWTEAAGPRRGHYARIWQRRAGGWVLLFDELLAVPAR